MHGTRNADFIQFLNLVLLEKDCGAGCMGQEMLTLYSVSKLSLVGEGQWGWLHGTRNADFIFSFLNLVCKQQTVGQFLNLVLLVKDSGAGCMEQETLTLYSVSKLVCKQQTAGQAAWDKKFCTEFSATYNLICTSKISFQL